MTSEDRIAALSATVTKLERRSRLTACVVVCLGLLAVSGRGMAKPDVGPADVFRSTGADSGLTLRERVIVDSMGTPRVRIAAPLPDPIMLGKRFNRGGVVSGILIYDAEGNERGGYVTGDESRGAALTLDEIMRAAVHIGVEDRGEAHVSVDNGLGGYGLLGINGRDGAYIRLHSAGKLTAVLPDTVATGSER